MWKLILSCYKVLNKDQLVKIKASKPLFENNFTVSMKTQFIEIGKVSKTDTPI